MTVTEAPNTETYILSFSLADQASDAIIDAGAHTISISVVHGTDQTTLSPTITVSEGASISPESGTAQDLSETTTYTVTAENGSTTQNWSITVTEAPNTATDILTFVLDEQIRAAIINVDLHTVSIEVSVNTDLSLLSPEITVSERATITPTSQETLDFSNPVSYIITAEDGQTQQEWIVTVTNELALNTVTEFGLEIYPNPTTEWLSVTHAPKNAAISLFTLFTSSGKLVKAETYNGVLKIDMRDRPAGVYYLRIHDPSTAKIHNNKILKR